MQGSFEARDPQMMEYLRVVKQVMNQFFKAKVVQVARGQNRHANSLATLASSLTEEVPWLIKLELVAKPSINVGVGVSVVAISELCWMDPIIDFLAEDQVSDDEKEAGRVCRVTARYWLSAYRRSFGGPYLLCLHPDKVNELLTEFHEGVCGNHVGRHSLAH